MKRTFRAAGAVVALWFTVSTLVPAACAADTAISLDGIDDHAYAPWVQALKSASQVAVEAWVKLSTTDSGGAEALSVGDRYLLRIKADGFPFFTIYNGSSWPSVSGGGSSLKDNIWHHVVGQKSSSSLTVYVDGVLRGTTNVTATIQFPTADLYVGKHGNGGTTYDFKGLIDEARIYNRALSSSEITAHYNAGVGQYGQPESGLVGGWHFNEGAGTTAADYSGTGITLTLKNGTVWAAGKVAGTASQTVATPTITPNGGTFAGSTQITLATSTSGATIRYTLDGSTPSSSSTLYSSPFTLSSTSTATLKAIAQKSGMTDSAIASAAFTITPPPDTTLPTGSISINAGAAATKTVNVTLTLSATDNAGSVTQMQFSNDGATYSTAEAYAATKAWALALGDGTKTIYAKFKDAAGNWSAPVTDTITLDMTAPSLTITSPADGAVIVAP